MQQRKYYRISVTIVMDCMSFFSVPNCRQEKTIFVFRETAKGEVTIAKMQKQITALLL